MGQPENSTWAATLQWLIVNMALDDKDLAFSASLLSHCLKHGGLTDRQERYAKRIVERFANNPDASDAPRVSPLRNAKRTR